MSKQTWLFGLLLKLQCVLSSCCVTSHLRWRQPCVVLQMFLRARYATCTHITHVRCCVSRVHWLSCSSILDVVVRIVLWHGLGALLCFLVVYRSPSWLLCGDAVLCLCWTHQNTDHSDVKFFSTDAVRPGEGDART